MENLDHSERVLYSKWEIFTKFHTKSLWSDLEQSFCTLLIKNDMQASSDIDWQGNFFVNVNCI